MFNKNLVDTKYFSIFTSKYFNSVYIIKPFEMTEL